MHVIFRESERSNVPLCVLLFLVVVSVFIFGIYHMRIYTTAGKNFPAYFLACLVLRSLFTSLPLTFDNNYKLLGYSNYNLVHPYIFKEEQIFKELFCDTIHIGVLFIIYNIWIRYVCLPYIP